MQLFGIQGFQDFSRTRGRPGYVTKDGEMKEDMVGLLNPTATTGAALAGDITNGITTFGLLLAKLRGQGYDGCAVCKYEWAY